MTAIKVIWDTGRFPNFFEMLGFSDLAVLASTWDKGAEIFQNDLRELAERLERSKVEYSRESRELPGRTANVESLFLRIWGLSDAHVRGVATPRARRSRSATQHAQPLGIQALEIRQEELEEMEQVLAAINATAAGRISPPRRIRRFTAADPGAQFTAFAPVASERWVEHTCVAFRHAIWRMDTFNHLSPMSIKALQFIAGITDEEAMKCQEIALDGELEHVGRM
ncbi:hypothetical protein CBR_g84053, partial [Chara braunii]